MRKPRSSDAPLSVQAHGKVCPSGISCWVPGHCSVDVYSDSCDLFMVRCVACGQGVLQLSGGELVEMAIGIRAMTWMDNTGAIATWGRADTPWLFRRMPFQSTESDFFMLVPPYTADPDWLSSGLAFWSHSERQPIHTHLGGFCLLTRSHP